MLKDRKTSATALSSLGHTHMCQSLDYSNGLSQSQTVLSDVQRAEEISKVKPESLVMLELCTCFWRITTNAIRCHQEHLKIAFELGDQTEEGRAYSNLGSTFHYKRDFEKAIQYHKKSVRCGKENEGLVSWRFVRMQVLGMR